MEIEVLQENLVKALTNVGRVASSRTGLPILGNILLKTSSNRLLVAATNLEIASTNHVGAKILKQGSITIPAKIITEFIQNLPKQAVKMSVVKSTLHIECGAYTSSINGVSDEEFPELPGIDEKAAVTYSLSTQDFKEATQQTIIAASSDSTRPVLTGVYWHVDDGVLYFAATDGYRLAEKQIMKVKTTIAAIVPVSTMQEVLRTITDEDSQIEVLFDEIQVRFRINDSEITSKLIDGNFPDYRQLIPKSSEISAVAERSDVARVAKIAALFARDSGGAITLSVDPETKNLHVHSVASELGENASSILLHEVKGSGSVTLNARYILELLSVVSSSTINIAFSGGLTPIVLTPNEKQSNYTHIIMPIKS